MQREGGETAYEAVSWTMEVPWTDDLAARIGAGLAAWLTKAQADAYKEAAAEVRAKRNELIAATDYQKCIDRLDIPEPSGTTFTSYKPAIDKIIDAATDAVAVYRQALRDVPEQEGFPFDVIWPEKP